MGSAAATAAEHRAPTELDLEIRDRGADRPVTIEKLVVQLPAVSRIAPASALTWVALSESVLVAGSALMLVSGWVSMSVSACVLESRPVPALMLVTASESATASRTAMLKAIPLMASRRSLPEL